MPNNEPITSTKLEGKAQASSLIYQSDEANVNFKTTTDNFPDWADDPENPHNWPAWKKNIQLAMLCSIATVGYY